MLFAVVLFGMISGSFACREEPCITLELSSQMYEMKFMPNKTQLDILCPEFINVLECKKELLECRGQRSLGELASSSDRKKAKEATAILDTFSVIREVCNDSSTLQQDYLESIECVRGEIINIGGSCLEVIMKPVEDFFKQLYPETDDYSAHIDHVNCLKNAFHTACMVDKLGEACGSVAKRTAVYALEKIKNAVKVNTCDDVSNGADLMSRMLDVFKIEEPKRSTYQRVLDFFTIK